MPDGHMCDRRILLLDVVYRALQAIGETFLVGLKISHAPIPLALTFIVLCSLALFRGQRCEFSPMTASCRQ